MANRYSARLITTRLLRRVKVVLLIVGLEASQPAPDEGKDGRLRRSLPNRPRTVGDSIHGRRLLVEHNVEVDRVVSL